MGHIPFVKRDTSRLRTSRARGTFPPMSDWLKSELQRVLEEKRLDAKNWSLRAGQSATYVRDIIRGRSKRPAADGLRKLAEAAGLAPGHFVKSDSEGATESRNSFTSNVKGAVDAPPYPVFGSMKQDVPLYGTAMRGNGDGDFEMNGAVIGTVPRLPGIEGRRDVFALNVVGDSMVPWRRPNGLIYVEEKRAPSVGDHVVVELIPNDGSPVRPALVKQLLSVSGSKVKLGQYNPKAVIELDRRRVHRIYRVLEWDDLLKGAI